jgi:hypothetical protein
MLNYILIKCTVDDYIYFSIATSDNQQIELSPFFVVRLLIRIMNTERNTIFSDRFLPCRKGVSVEHLNISPKLRKIS